jgi:ABC-type nitrate/sulfonate/bicarbonate transport system permease component
MKKSAVIFIFLLGIFLAAWSLIAIVNTSGLIPSPREVVCAVVQNWSPLLVTAIITAKQAVLGLAVSITAAAFVVFCAGACPDFERAIYPFVVMLKATPALAFVPLIMVIVGGGWIGKSLVAAIISFLPLAVSGLSGLHDVPGPLRALKRHYRPNNWTFFTTVGWPYTLHGFCLGLELAAPMAVVGAIVSDFIVGGVNGGLGSFITSANSTLTMKNVAAGGLVATLLGVGLFFVAHVVFVIVRKRFHLAT